jgi:Fe-S-cluster containining protein
MKNTRLRLSEARESPCDTCATTPCCSHLPLHSFQVATLRDLDHAVYLLNFERIQLGLARSGEWSVYYRYPCRFLAGSRCTLHGTPEQPKICVHYNPYTCWYKRTLTQQAEDFLRIDRRRLDAILDVVEFDDERRITGVPDWPALLAIAEAIPIEEDFDPPPTEDAAFDTWLRSSAAGVRLPMWSPAGYRYEQFLDPCTGCQAHCCTTLVFPHPIPVERRNLDYLQFALGFPGIELGIADGVWQLIVKTRCRHLTADNRCGVFGQPHRPMLCKYYDASSCSYVVRFGDPRPPGFVRLRLEQFRWFVEQIRFDAEGAILGLPATEPLRSHIEVRWREAVAAVTPSPGPDPAQSPTTDPALEPAVSTAEEAQDNG